jgi:hypothetical protein
MHPDGNADKTAWSRLVDGGRDACRRRRAYGADVHV